MANRRIQRCAVIASSVAVVTSALACAGTTEPRGIDRFAGRYAVTTALQTYSFINFATAPNPADPYAHVSVPAGAAATSGTMVVRFSGGSTLDVTVTMDQHPCTFVTEPCTSSVDVYHGTMSLSQDSTEASIEALSTSEGLSLERGKLSGRDITGSFGWFLRFGPAASSYSGTFVAVRLPP
jgi:hypothetical protein